MVPVTIGNGTVSHPTETANGFDWVYGPRGLSVLHAPFEYRLHRDPGLLNFDISIYWSIWTKDGPGRADVTDGINLLLEDGWQGQ
ncbi:hypothetical protein AB0I10_08195 [Streptomyces sp. NPDC050636]|uniref:hypothetical protein n=1 Tax=Streptomyces sp. NPDC050636 TaxID=3154510 RepID=UPI003428D119